MSPIAHHCHGTFNRMSGVTPDGCTGLPVSAHPGVTVLAIAHICKRVFPPWKQTAHRIPGRLSDDQRFRALFRLIRVDKALCNSGS